MNRRDCDTGRNARDAATRDRGQLVLTLAAVAAIALVTIAGAYAQLGSHPDVAARTDPGVTTDRVLAGLDRAVENASAGVSGRVAWEARDEALGRFTAAFESDAAAIARAAANRTVLVRVDPNATAASRWADRHCPGGPNRAFGDCVIRDGVVIQERNGDAHVVSVALDVTVTGADGETRVTVVVQSI